MLSSLASLTRAVSSLCCTLATSAGSTSASRGPGVLSQRKLPLRGGQANAAGLLVKIAEMLVHRGVGLVAFNGLAQILFGQFVLAHLEVGPAERVEIGAVHRLQFDGFANHLQRFRQLGAFVGEHVAEIVQDHGVGWGRDRAPGGRNRSAGS